jgi:hypothetical protein
LFMVCVGCIYYQCNTIHNYIFTKIKENKINKTTKKYHKIKTACTAVFLAQTDFAIQTNLLRIGHVQ